MNKIMIALDGSESAEAALEPSLELARRFGAGLMLVRATVLSPAMWDDDPAIHTFEELRQAERAECERYLSGVATACSAVTVETLVVDDIAGLLECARRERFDLIVVSTRGRQGLARWWYGSVAEKLLRHSGCSVWVLHAGDTVAPLDNRVALVPLDGSQRAESALESALKMAGRVVVTRCLNVPDLKFLLPADQYVKFLHEEQQAVDAYFDELEKRYPEKVRCVLASGKPAAEILRVADEEKAHMIAMSSHGRSGFERWLLGSVTEEVLRRATLPVLVVREPVLAESPPHWQELASERPTPQS